MFQSFKIQRPFIFSCQCSYSYFLQNANLYRERYLDFQERGVLRCTDLRSEENQNVNTDEKSERTEIFRIFNSGVRIKDDEYCSNLPWKP